jgi:Zn-dependent protease with chaperone function
MSGMTREAFVAQLARLRPLAETDPTAYRRRVQGWALLGYGFILLLLIGSVGLMGLVAWLTMAFGIGALAWKVIPVLGFFSWKIVRSMWVTFDPPEGHRLTRAEAGPLLDLVQQQARILNAPKVHRVLLTSEYNAAAVQVPRLGALGWPLNYVLVGLPLLHTLSPEQAAAVVAHELGHLRGGHSRFGAWIYRIDQSWSQLVGQLEKTKSRTVFHRFADWYVPRFNAWSHPLRRASEFEADAAAATLTSAAALAEALCAITVRDSALDRLHWDVLQHTLADEPAPPHDAISRLLPLAKTAQLPAHQEQRLLTAAAVAEPDPFDTHPTLGERLAALGQSAAVPPLPTTSAAEVWFGSQLPKLAQTLDAQWASDRATWWRQRHDHLRSQHLRLDQLNERIAKGEMLSEDEAWEHADLTEDYVGANAALPLLRALFTSEKWENAAKFVVGRILTNQDDPAGLDLLDEVMANEPDVVAMGLAVQEAYHQRHGNRDTARRLNTLQLQHADKLDEALAERHSVTAEDSFIGHGLTEEELGTLGLSLATQATGIARTWLLRKELTHFADDKPLYVLLVQPLPSETQGTNWVQQLAAQVVLPGECFVVATGPAHAWLEKRACAITEAEVFVPEAVS